LDTLKVATMPLHLNAALIPFGAQPLTIFN
jgi:hypothetical protein